MGHVDAEDLNSFRPIPNDRVGTVNTWMEICFPRYALCHCQFGTLRPDDWIMKQSTWIFLLIIAGADHYGDELEHVSVIDVAAGAIIDCSVAHTLRLERSVLCQCVCYATFRGSTSVNTMLVLELVLLRAIVRP